MVIKRGQINPCYIFSTELSMDRESGTLSIDFTIGFAVFMIGFIFVATLVGGLLIGLQSKTIDYDAVAYRTSVILVEDPGEPRIDPYAVNPDPLDLSWEQIGDPVGITRLGLLYSKEHPGVLSGEKVDRFFKPGEFTNTEYQDRLLLSQSGQYPYHFQIRLSGYLNPVGDTNPPELTGYMKRAVLVKEYSMPITLNNPVEYVNVTLPLSDVQSDRGALYGINTRLEPIEIFIDIDPAVLPLDLINVFLTPPDDPSFIYDEKIPVQIGSSATGDSYTFFVNEITDSIKLRFEPDYFSGYSVEDVVLHIQFAPPPPPVDNREVTYTPPPLTPATLEVKIW